MNNDDKETSYPTYDKKKVDESIKKGVSVVKTYIIGKIIKVIFYIILMLVLVGVIFALLLGLNAKVIYVLIGLIIFLFIILLLLRKSQKK